ncbi:hypothetical protein PTKU46_84220 [Paraburkholderia terrae]|uniref:hypothetical protein n=1 Tax=Paraburkholderia terrae TaxID=311230 RepID=UPI0030E4236A
MIKPWQVCERSARIGIRDHHCDAFASGLIDDASDLWTSDALSIKRKDGYDGVALTSVNKMSSAVFASR